MKKPSSGHDLHFLFEASRRLNRTLILESLLAEIRDLILEAMRVEAVSLLVWNEPATRLEFYLAHNQIGEERERPSLAPGEGMAGWIAENDAAVMSNEARSDPRFRHILDAEVGFRTKSLLGIPLHRAGDVFGVLEALNRTDDEGFNADDARLLEALGDQISVALDNALTYQTARRQRAENEALYQIGLVLGRSLELEEVIEILLDQLRRVVPYDAAALYLSDGETGDLSWFNHRGYEEGTVHQVKLKIGQGAVGWVAGAGEPLNIPDVSKDSRYFDARPETCSEMLVPILAESRVIGVLNLEADRVDHFSNSDLRLTQSFAAQAAISIERTKLNRQIKEKDRLEEQLTVARQIQNSFLPSTDPEIEGIDLSGLNIPSEQVSGDVYDFVPIHDQQLGILIGDVSGKGISAALIMAALRASIRAEARNRFAISDILQNVNYLLWESIEPGKFATAVYGVLDEKKRRFSYANAGHNAPILLRKDGSIERLREGGPILGPFPQIPYELGLVVLESGDLLGFYTDGVTEAGLPEKEPFGSERLGEALLELRGRPSSEICQGVVRKVREYAGPTSRGDDITLVVLQVL